MFDQEFDIVEEALVKLSYDMMPEDSSDQELDDFTDKLFLTINEMVIDETIPEMPSDDVSDEEKKVWIDVALPKIKERLNGNKNSSE